MLVYSFLHAHQLSFAKILKYVDMLIKLHDSKKSRVYLVKKKKRYSIQYFHIHTQVIILMSGSCPIRYGTLSGQKNPMLCYA